ncbi:MAG: hypothetical protein SAJ37_17530 [Oscillatoria sp. PMC 1068.18]|nr:hypothetical protein [Oscillatoria sp. PMC 1076.18]MEC4990535.1 hypothetical protein [Oscillatoria sp. PMC 1068.18]
MNRLFTVLICGLVSATATVTDTSGVSAQEAKVSKEFQLAQGGQIAGECRQATRQTDIYLSPSLSSGVVYTLQQNEPVVLRDNGANGWISVSSPVGGYAIARHLTFCNNNQAQSFPTPRAIPPLPFSQIVPPSVRAIPPIPATATVSLPRRTVNSSSTQAIRIPRQANSCRVALVNLAIRPQPLEGATPAQGSVKAGQTMRLTGVTQQGEGGRTWYQISAPNRGWISGQREGGSNIDVCS